MVRARKLDPGIESVSIGLTMSPRKHGSLRSNSSRHISSASRLFSRCLEARCQNLSPAQTHPETSLQLRDYFQLRCLEACYPTLLPAQLIQTHLSNSDIIIKMSQSSLPGFVRCKPGKATTFGGQPTLQCLQALIPDFVTYDRKSLDLPGQCSSRFLHRKEGGSEDDDEETLAEATAEDDLRSCPQHYPQNPHILPVPQGTRETHTIFVELSSRAVALFAYVQSTSHRTCLLSNSDSIPKQRHDFAQSKALELFL